MEDNIKINYYWDTSDYPELSATIIKKLKQHAEERIFEMRIEGYTQGELIYETNKIYARGWWSFYYYDNDI
jgi:hypothetical protein